VASEQTSPGNMAAAARPPSLRSEANLTTTLAEGVARLIEKQIAVQHARRVDDVTISPRPPGQGGRGRSAGLGAGSAQVVDARALQGEAKEAIDRLLRQETNRTAFRTLYRQRVATFQQSLDALESDVARELEAMPRPEVVVGVRGREDTQIVISRAAPPEAEEAGGAAAAAPGPGQTAASAGPSRTTNKAVLREGLVWASGQALAELGLDPEQPFQAGLAMQILSHPQMRPLVLVALPDGVQRARQAEAALRGVGADDAGEAPGPAVPRPPRTLTRRSRPRKKVPLVKVTVKRPRA
jgi:hypothetical protein